MMMIASLILFTKYNMMPDELLDVINDNDIITGQEFRSVVHRTGLQHRGAHVFLVTPENQLLIQRRGKDRKTFPQAIDCSVSEHVQAGEGYLQAAKRGLQEELGISNVDLQALVKFQLEYGPNDFEISTLFEGIVDPKSVHANPLEVETIAAYHLDEILELINNGKEAICSWFVQIVNWYLDKPSDLAELKVYTNNRQLLVNK